MLKCVIVWLLIGILISCVMTTVCSSTPLQCMGVVSVYMLLLDEVYIRLAVAMK